MATIKQIHTITLLIPAGTFFAQFLDISLVEPVSLTMPALWTAAPISFFVSADAINYGWLSQSTGAPVRIAPAIQGRHYRLEPAWFAGLTRLVVTSGQGDLGAFVAQAADRYLQLQVRDRYT